MGKSNELSEYWEKFILKNMIKVDLRRKKNKRC